MRNNIIASLGYTPSSKKQRDKYGRNWIITQRNNANLEEYNDIRINSKMDKDRHPERNVWDK